MNILVLSEIHPNKLGSMEEFCLFLARELFRRGHRCFFGFTGEPDPVVRKMLEEAGAIIADELVVSDSAQKGGLAKRSGGILQLYKFIKKKRIDLIHLTFYSVTNPYLVGAYFSSTKIVFTEKMSLGVPQRGSVKQLFSKIIHGFLTRRISRYTGITDFIRNRMEISHHVFPPQSLTIYNGVNLNRFVDSDRAAARLRLDIPADSKIVLAVAALIPEKGLQFLIEAVDILVHEYEMSDFCAVLVGEGNYRRELEQKVADLGLGGQISFMGMRSDVADFIAAADLVTVPSIWQEAFGFIVAEAMASARPVIASRVGGIPELIDDGVTGLLVEPGDSRALAAGMAAILSDTDFARRLADKALQKCRNQFNLAEIVIEYVNLFERVLRQ